MVKIERDRRSSGDYPLRGKPDVKSVDPSHKGEFARDLTDKQDRDYHVRMQELLSEIDKVAGRLQKTFDINDLMKYKKLVQNFLKEATAMAYATNRESSFHRRGRSIMISVKRINQEVEEMIEEFMAKKQDPIGILETMDKIRGMLLDLMA